MMTMQALLWLGGRAPAWFWLGMSALVKGAALLAVTALVSRLVARSSAALRHLVWALGLGGVLLVSAIGWFLPSWAVNAPGWLLYSPRASALGEAARAFFAQEGAAGGVVRASLPAGTTAASLSDGAGVFSMVALVLCAVWAAIAGLLLGRLILDLRAARRLARRATPVPAGRSREIARTVVERLSFRLLPELRESVEIDVPVTTGIRRPLILLPAQAAQWTDQQLDAVLSHELAHAQRRDCITQLLARVACAVHWPNPLAWWAARRLLAEREMAADDAALRGGSPASDYARLLLHLVAAAGSRPSAAPGGALSMAGVSPLRERVARLLDPARSRAVVPRRLVAVAAVGLLAIALPLGCLGGGGPSTEARPPSVAQSARSQSPTRAPEKLWLAIARAQSALGRRLTEAVARDAQAGARGLEARLEQWKASPDGSPVHDRYVEGPFDRLRELVADVVREQAPAAHERVLLDGQAGGRARTFVVDLDTKLELDRPAVSLENQDGRAVLELRFREPDARRISQVTRANLGQRMAIVVGQDRLLAVPVIRAAIDGGRAQISLPPEVTEAEAKELADSLDGANIPEPTLPRKTQKTP